MPPHATRNPLITEVVRNEIPVVMPTRPLALSRSSSGIRTVTTVGSAIVRRLPASTPPMINTMSTQRYGCPSAVKTARSTDSNNTRASAYRRKDAVLDHNMTVRLRWWSTMLPNQNPDTASEPT